MHLLMKEVFHSIGTSKDIIIITQVTANIKKPAIVPYSSYYILKALIYTANVYRQTTDKLMFKSVISTVR